MRRALITSAVVVFAAIVAVALFINARSAGESDDAPQTQRVVMNENQTRATRAEAQHNAQQPSGQAARTKTTKAKTAGRSDGGGAAMPQGDQTTNGRATNESKRDTPPSAQPSAPRSIRPLGQLHVVEVSQRQPAPVIGGHKAPSRSDNPYLLEAALSPWGAGVKRIVLSSYSAELNEHVPYPIQTKLLYTVDETPNGVTIKRYRYPMAAWSVTINGQRVLLWTQRWNVVQERTDRNRATFELVIADASGEKILRITRSYTIQPGEYDLELDQKITNLSAQPLRVRFSQLAQGDLPPTGGYMGDMRTVVMGYFDLDYDPRRLSVYTEGFYYYRQDVAAPDRDEVLWSDRMASANIYQLAWAAMSNRYFTTVLYRPVQGEGSEEQEGGVAPLEGKFNFVRRYAWDLGVGKGDLMLMVASEPMRVAPDGVARLDLALYAGPKDPDVLRNAQEYPVYAALGLGNLIVYNLGGMCAFVTFSWLANFLLWFLGLMHMVVWDWGVAIILLVAVVRFTLHPLMRRSQMNMMRASRKMQKLQPELERIKKKYEDDKQKYQQEMMKLYKEKGVNPMAMGMGCLPMLLQTPIWIALYAVLYFAIELRHEAAFWGVFQAISGGQWLFLADLSKPDGFLPIPGDGFSVFGWEVTSINLLPILMGFTFYLQQKYSASPQMQPQSDQAKAQQTAMKFTILLFPVLLYLAPSGLTLYILTSTGVGIIESRRIRKHLEQEEAEGKLDQPRKRKEGGFMDRLMKAAEAKQREMEAQQKGSGGGGGGGGRGGKDGRSGRERAERGRGRGKSKSRR